VAHLSYKRVGKAEDARLWKFDVIAGVIGNAFRLFLQYVDPDLLCEGFEQHLRRSRPTYLNAPTAMSFRPNCKTSPAIAVPSQGLLTSSSYIRRHVRADAPEEPAVRGALRLTQLGTASDTGKASAQLC
jgi:hypothetical protein